MTDLTELRQSEAVVIAQCVRTRGAFLDEIECKPEDFINLTDGINPYSPTAEDFRCFL